MIEKCGSLWSDQQRRSGGPPPRTKGVLLRRRSLGLVLAALLLTALVSLGKVKSSAARGPRTKEKRSHVLHHPWSYFHSRWGYIPHLRKHIHHPRVTVALAQRAVVIARRLVGVPYAWGGTSPASGFDCSGLVYFVYSRLGIHLPRSSLGQMEVGRWVRRSRLKPGDLLFFHGSSHVGLYLGHGRFIHAPHSGARVTVASLDAPWFSSGYDGARRVIREPVLVERSESGRLTSHKRRSRPGPPLR